MVAYTAAAHSTWQLLMGALHLLPAHYAEISQLRLLVYGLADAGPLYWVVLFVGSARHYYERYEHSLIHASDLNAQLARAQLHSLKMQLHPHFLFNTLHAISELIHEDADAAECMLIKLSQLLRISLDTSAAIEVPLSQEIRFTELYLEIEKMRFEDRLEVLIGIQEGLHNALVPNLILQPLVENAIKHGISKRADGGRIEVTVSREDGRLVIRVLDNGNGPEPPTSPLREGIGLRTTRTTLERLYPGRHSFEFSARAGAVTEVVIHLPFQMETREVEHELTGSAGC